MRARRLVLLAVLPVIVTGCGSGSDTAASATGSATATATPSASPTSLPAPDIVLPADPLRDLVPRTADLPPGLVAILSGSGPRDAKAVAAYSSNPAQAGALLTRHGFRSAYVAQYADPATGRVLSVVVSRFSAAGGATADLDSDLAASSGEQVPAATVGEKSQVRRQPLPGGTGQLVTVRFRKGATTWLVAYGAPTAEPQVAVDLAKVLAARG